MYVIEKDDMNNVIRKHNPELTAYINILMDQSQYFTNCYKSLRLF